MVIFKLNSPNSCNFRQKRIKIEIKHPVNTLLPPSTTFKLTFDETHDYLKKII